MRALEASIVPLANNRVSPVPRRSLGARQSTPRRHGWARAGVRPNPAGTVHFLGGVNGRFGGVAGHFEQAAPGLCGIEGRAYGRQVFKRMSSVYIISSALPDDDPVEGFHPYRLPNAPCPACGKELGSGRTYPFVDPHKVFDPRTVKSLELDRSDDCSWETFQRLAGTLAPHLPPELPISPGTSLGAFSGRVSGPLGDVDMPKWELLIVRVAVCTALEAQGVRLRVHPPNLKFRGKNDESATWLEVWAPPCGRAGPSWETRYCGFCKRSSGRPARVLSAKDIPTDVDVFTALDSPRFVYATERFIDAIQPYNPKNIRVEPAAVE